MFFFCHERLYQSFGTSSFLLLQCDWLWFCTSLCIAPLSICGGQNSRSFVLHDHWEHTIQTQKKISQVDALFRKIGPIVLYVGSSQPPNKEAVNQKKNKEAQFCCSTHDSELTHRNTSLFLSHWTNHSNTILISQSSLELSFPQFYKDFIWINSISQTSRMPGPCSEESRTDWLFTHIGPVWDRGMRKRVA